MTKKVSKQAAFLAYLQKGNTVTYKQAKALFKLNEPSVAVTQLRKQGYCIYSEDVVLSNGRPAVSYRIGEPTRELIAAGFAVLGSGRAGRASK